MKKTKLSSKKQIEHEVIYKSLIGKEIEIIESKLKSQVGIKGILINETANFLIISQNGSIKRIFKSNVQIKVTVKGKPLKVNARLLIGTITNRLKKLK